MKSVLRMKSRKDYESKLGKPIYSFTINQKIKRATITLENEVYPILMPSFDIEACDAMYEPFLILDPLTKVYVKHYSINVTGVPAATGLDSEEPFVFPALGEDSGDGGGDETERDAEGDGESTLDDSLFG